MVGHRWQFHVATDDYGAKMLSNFCNVTMHRSSLQCEANFLCITDDETVQMYALPVWQHRPPGDENAGLSHDSLQKLLHLLSECLQLLSCLAQGGTSA